MPADTTKVKFACRATKDGNVELLILDRGKVKAGLSLKPEAVGSIVATLFAAAQEASAILGSRPAKVGESLTGKVAFRPVGIGLSVGEPPEPPCFLIHAGKACLGIVLDGDRPRELAQALQTLSAPQGRQM